ncbi:MAG: biosynthetic-type acetolactate synthase large subunit [Gemmataceae bacterium]|nr:biosynthetic-type acetolactate synthase large subunit [Gemmataceae bacterium]
MPWAGRPSDGIMDCCPPAESDPMTRPTSPIPGAQILVQCLLDRGVDTIFAYPGGASMPLHQALTRVEGRLRTILPRHEQGGGFGAAGYARATGKVGVCLSTSGPGATNFVTCLADSKMDSCPIIAITGQVGTPVIGTDAFQETPIVEVCRAITKHHYLIQRTEDIPRVVKEAIHIASTGRPGPVLIDVPKDVQVRQIVVEDWDPPMNLPGYKPEQRATRQELEQVLALVRESRKPIIYAGGGIITAGASAHLRTFAEKLGIPVAMTLHGLGGFPAEHFLALHMLGMHGTVYSNYAINEADLLLAFGVRFDDRVTGKVSEFAKHGRIVHIDIDPSELNKNKVAHLPIHGDIGHALHDLCRLIEADPVPPVNRHGEWIRQIEEWRENEPLKYAERDDAILPQQIIRRLWEILKGRGALDDTIVSTGVGQHQMWAAQYFPLNKPRLWLTSGGLGTMGFGLPAAMGAQAAFPLKTCIDIDGDGSFLMNIQELATCFTEKLPVKVLLLNNQHLGMVVQWEDRFFAGNRGHTYLGAGHGEEPYPDFVALAKGFRCGSRRISRPEDVDGALEELLDSKGPFVLDVMVPYQEHVLPMIPSGQTVRDMIKA